MKIGITRRPTYGGSGAVAIELAERGHEIHLISYARPFRPGSRHDVGVLEAVA